MIEIISVREIRYSSPIEVPIEKKEVIRDKRYYYTIQHLYEEARKKVSQKTKEIYGDEHYKNIWREVSGLFDKEFLIKLISIWKEKVFKKIIKISKEISLEEEQQIIQECLEDNSLQVELELYFLSDFWNNISLSSMITEKNSIK